MQATFKTIANRGESLFKDRGSKFIGIAVQVANEQQAKDELEAIKNSYHDARHHCYAYILGVNGENFRANDDGEPNHSAGDPILGQIRSLEITNTMVVVVRYLGGTKLGVSGLINAYKMAAEQALAPCKIIKKEVTADITLIYPYEDTNVLMRLVDEFNIQITHQDFTDQCTLNGSLRIDKVNMVEEKIELLNSTGRAIKFIKGKSHPNTPD